MPYIKIDINEILKSKHWIPVLIATLIGLIAYKIFKNDLIMAIICGIAALLVCELILLLINKKQKSVYSAIDSEYELKEMRNYADATMTFFKTLTDEQLQYAIQLYKLPRNETDYIYERYVDLTKTELPLYSNTLFSNGRINFVEFEEDSGSYYTHRTPIKHIIFNPLFYHILDNYVQHKKIMQITDKELKKYMDFY